MVHRRRRRPAMLAIITIFVTTCTISTIRPSSAWAPAPHCRRTNAGGQVHAFSPITIMAAKKAKKNTKRSTNNKSSGGGGGGGGFGRINKSDTAVLSISPPPTTLAAAPMFDTKELAVYEKYVKEESSRQKKDVNPGLVQISSSPLMFTMENFMNADACTTLTEDDSEAFCLEFRDNVAQLLGGQMGALDGMKFNYASSRDANNDATSEQVSFPDGVHMDTNNDCIFRHLTAILYLNDVPTECGGATLFPLARAFNNDPALGASKRLLQEKIGHTRSCGVVRKSGLHREADGRLLESRVGSQFLQNPKEEGAIRVQPQAGKLLLFFSRTASGREDPRSWHGGERLRHGNESKTTEKRILTIFKQVDYGLQQPAMAESSFETYLSHQIQTQSQSLLRLSQL